jgi:nitrite reductase/ring-hydroxylating ferredoxin subunit/uncharacterized membrane protein
MPHGIKHILQGRPIGHPLHTMLVHLPIGLWLLSFVLDVLALAGGAGTDDGARALVRAARYTLLAGLGVAVLAAITGFADYTDVRKDHPARRTATWHMVLNLCAVAVFGVSALYRIHQPSPDVLPAALSGAGVVLVGISGYLGGTMVYDDGVGVGRHRRAHDVRPTTRVDAAPDDDGYVAVMDADDLPADTPTRVEANGHAIVLVRTAAGDVYAVQEYCTHRCAPLSEGAVEGGNLRCPWHRSCFELRTGNVAEGPAKVELRTYPVREEDGRVWVGITERNK